MNRRDLLKRLAAVPFLGALLSSATLELEAGPDLDAQIAKVLGLTYRRTEGRIGCVVHNDGWHESFEPSTNAADAFHVGDRFHLLEGYEGELEALPICAEILKRKGEQ